MIITHRDNHAWPHANCEVQLLCAFVKTDAKRWSVSIRNAPSKFVRISVKILRTIFIEISMTIQWFTDYTFCPWFRTCRHYLNEYIWRKKKKKTDTCMQKFMDKQKRADWWSFCTIIYWLITTEALFSLNFTINFE